MRKFSLLFESVSTRSGNGVVTTLSTELDLILMSQLALRRLGIRNECD